MGYLKNIITYFFHHPASDGVVERVHQRLADTNSGQEKEAVSYTHLTLPTNSLV